MTSLIEFIPWFLRPSRLGGTNSLILGLILGCSLTGLTTGLAVYSLDSFKRRLRKPETSKVIEIRENEVLNGVEALIGLC